MDQPNDFGDWTQTFSGRHVYPMAAKGDFAIEDIAHALSNLCRFNGHVKSFYSVAQHCYLASMIVPAEHAFQALMHDASEAYLCDIPKPLKPQLKGYAEVEERLMVAIAKQLGFPWPISEEVKLVDLQLVATEAKQLLPYGPIDWVWDWQKYVLADFTIEPWLSAKAELLFLKRFLELAGVARFERVDQGCAR